MKHLPSDLIFFSSPSSFLRDVGGDCAAPDCNRSGRCLACIAEEDDGVTARCRMSPTAGERLCSSALVSYRHHMKTRSPGAVLSTDNVKEHLTVQSVRHITVKFCQWWRGIGGFFNTYCIDVISLFHSCWNVWLIKVTLEVCSPALLLTSQQVAEDFLHEGCRWSGLRLAAGTIIPQALQRSHSVIFTHALLKQLHYLF